MAPNSIWNDWSTFPLTWDKFSSAKQNFGAPHGRPFINWDLYWVFIGRIDVEAETPNTLATWCEELTHLKRPWCWERLRAGGEGDNRGWNGWMASPTQWTWVWVDSGSWWWTGRRGMLQFMGLQRVGHDWATELTDWLSGETLCEGTNMAWGKWQDWISALDANFPF